MELAHQLHLRRAVLRAQWVPRLQNEEADALTNSDFPHFRPENRVKVELENLNFLVMNELFAEGEDYVKELDELRVAEKAAKSGRQTRPFKRAKGDRLAVRDPWDGK